MTSTLKQTFAITALNLALVSAALSAPARLNVSLDKSWKFIRQDVADANAVKFDDSTWQAVALPHTWNNLDGQDGGGNYYRGPAWYRRHFKPDSQYAGKSLFLKFDAASIVADVFVNGAPVGTHKGSFAAFCFDVTPLLHVGQDNVIAVRVSNASNDDVAPLSGDFTVFGGLYRDAHLLVLDNLSVSPLDYASPGVYIKQVAITPEKAELEITTKIRNANSDAKTASVHYLLTDRDGKTVQELNAQQNVAAGVTTDVVQQVSVASPHLWNGLRDAYMYQLTVEIRDGKRLTDRVTQPVGLRSFRFDKDLGFFLNGAHYPLYGVNRHQDRLDKGWAIGPREHDEDFKLIQELGCTAVRLAHYQHAQYFYDLCDRGGMVVWAEIPLVNALGASDAFAENARQQLSELIKQNFNHPSIVVWSLFNELHSKTSWNEPPEKWDLIPELNKQAKELDPTRPTTAAVCILPQYPLNLVTDTIGFNRYAGWYFGKPSDLPGVLDGMRTTIPDRAIGISEYGAGACIDQHELNPQQPKPTGHWHPEEYQSVLHEQAWKDMKARPWIWCEFIWNLCDFAVDNRDEGDQLGRNDKGLVTYDRKTKKDAFFWYKANWSNTPFVYITSRRFVKRTEPQTPVKLYSNCDTIQLRVNGVSRRPIPSDDHIFLWNNITLKRGPNHIVATGIRNGKKYTDSCVWDYELSAKQQ